MDESSLVKQMVQMSFRNVETLRVLNENDRLQLDDNIY